MSTRIVFIVFTLGASLLLVLNFFGQTPNELLGGRSIDEKVENIPFAIARQATSLYFDKNGELSYSFTAEKLTHFRTQNHDSEENIAAHPPPVSYTLISQPHVNMYRKDAPWVIDAERGKIISDEGSILLEEKVSVSSRDTNENQIELNTEKLIIYPGKKMAKTDSVVTITSKSGIITAQGMVADIEAKKIKLLANVEGEHDPIKVKP